MVNNLTRLQFHRMNKSNNILNTLPNIHQQAVAITYEAGTYAPKVVAKGKGIIAEQIIAKAKEHKVFVHESKELVGLLMQVDLDDHIPPELYLAIAEILAWLYRLESNNELVTELKT